MPDILVFGIPILIAVAPFLLPVPEAGRKFPLKWRLAISVLGLLALAAAIWQQRSQAREKQEARNQLQAAQQQYAVDVAVMRTRLEDIAVAIGKAADKNPALLPLAETSKTLAEPSRASIAFYRETLVRFTHGLKTRTPRITCLDPAGKTMYPGSITPLDENTVVMNMVTPLTGSCSAQR